MMMVGVQDAGELFQGDAVEDSLRLEQEFLMDLRLVQEELLSIFSFSNTTACLNAVESDGI